MNYGAITWSDYIMKHVALSWSINMEKYVTIRWTTDMKKVYYPNLNDQHEEDVRVYLSTRLKFSDKMR